MFGKKIVNGELFKKSLEEQVSIEGGTLSPRKVISILQEQINPFYVGEHHLTKASRILGCMGWVRNNETGNYCHKDYPSALRLRQIA